MCLGIKSIRTSITGFPLPNPRSVSARVHKDIPKPHRTDISFMFAAFGQLIDHDLTLTAETKGDQSFIVVIMDFGLLDIIIYFSFNEQIQLLDKKLNVVREQFIRIVYQSTYQLMTNFSWAVIVKGVLT